MNPNVKPLNLRPGLNGDTAEGLQDQAVKILEALLNLHRAVTEAAPHGRNYQHLPGAEAGRALIEDRARWRVALDALEKVEDFTDALVKASTS